MQKNNPKVELIQQLEVFPVSLSAIHDSLPSHDSYDDKAAEILQIANDIKFIAGQLKEMLFTWREYADIGSKVQAIKALRDQELGLGLKEAKDFIELYMQYTKTKPQ